MQTAKPVLFPEVTDAVLKTEAASDEQAALVSALGARTAVVVPLIARGHPIGTLSLASAAPGRRFGPADVELAQEVARRAAFAIDNARLYRESQEAIKLRDEFLAVASHELRTPLTPMQLQLSQLQRALEKHDLEGMSQELDTSLRQLDRLSGLVEDLLDVTTISSGQLNLKLERIDLSDLVGRVAAEYRDAFSRSGSTLTIRAPKPIFGCWDRRRIEQIIVALLSNAAKYGAKHPIVIEVGREGPLATMSVRDFGVGIAPEDQARIFQRFGRAASVRHYGGLGLGLYIASRSPWPITGTSA